ncbi:hypothetical protein BH10PSE3_BH10PSE3_14810 [soil metagenome]
MTATFAARPFEARITPAGKRARAFLGRLRWAVFAMVLLNVVVWGGMIAALRGVVDLHGMADQAWALGAAWIAALPHVSITISR